MIQSTSNSSFDWLSSIKADYAAMKPGRFNRRRLGTAPDGGSADYHYRSQAKYMKLIEDARDMDRNDAVIGQGVDRAVGNILRRGFTLDVNTGDVELDKELQARFEEWSCNADECDLSGEMTFKEIERLSVRQMMVDGDINILPISRDASPALQVAEAHRLRTPQNTTRNVVHGVLLDDHRRRLEYWFSKDDIDPMRSIARVGDMVRWPVRDENGNRQLFHLMDPKRATQTRGVSVLSPIFTLAGMFEDTNVAMIAKQQLAASIGLIRKMQNPNAGFPSMGGTRTDTRSDGSAQTIVSNAGPGIEFRVGLDDEIEAFSPNIPGNDFFQHMKMILTIIGLNLGLPLVMFLMDGSETNFSGWRGAIDQGKIRFEQVQDQIARRLHIPLYRWWVRDYLKNDSRLASLVERSGVDPFGHAWVVPTWPYVQPLQDVQTDGLRLKYRLISPRGICGERGKNFERVIEETIKDNEFAITAANESALRLNEQYPSANVNWRELWSMPVVDGVTIPQTTGANPNDGTND